MSDKESSKGILFHYIKSHNFRVTHIDGIVGSRTPAGFLHMALFSERPAIPQKIIHELNPDGSLGAQIESEGRTGFVREMDIDAVMNLETAISIRDWLSKTIEEIQATPQTEHTN